MLLDRKQTAWVSFSVLAGAAAAVAYLFDPDARLNANGHEGSSWVGLVLGVAALAIMLFCSALSLKRKVPHWRLGRAQTWLRGHVWLGLLSVWLIALHSGFKTGGALTQWLWVLVALVSVSAVFGLTLQQFIPRLMLHSVPGETLAQQIQRQLNNLREFAEQTVITYAGSLDTPAPDWEPAASTVQAATADAPAPNSRPAPSDPAPASAKGQKSETSVNTAGAEPLRRFYIEYARAYFAGEESPLQSSRTAESLLTALRTMTPAHVHPAVDDLEFLCERRRQLIRQRALHRVLCSWLIIHVPVSWLLLILVFIHAVFALKFSFR